METLHAIARPQADPGRPRRALERAESGPKSEREPWRRETQERPGYTGQLFHEPGFWGRSSPPQAPQLPFRSHLPSHSGDNRESLLAVPEPIQSIARLMRRFRRLLRAAVTASFVLAVWTVARPAGAATLALAPFCDDRGASAVAAAPTLEATDEAIRRARTTVCDESELAPFASIGRSKGVSAVGIDTAASARTTETTCLPDFAGSPIDAVCAIQSSPLGVHSRIERPPRG
jgi:hypothetical protein